MSSNPKKTIKVRIRTHSRLKSFSNNMSDTFDDILNRLMDKCEKNDK